MIDTPLISLSAYSNFVSETLNRTSVNESTLSVWSTSPYTGIAEGEILFKAGYKLRLREEIDFDAGLITSYGYEVYLNENKLYWYDDFPHPNDPELAETFPHHKHIPPNIKRNRISAPNISFSKPNLDIIIFEIEQLINSSKQ